MWHGEMLILLLVLFGCADYIYFQQVLIKQNRRLEPSVDSPGCQTPSCKAKRQIEDGVLSETTNVAGNSNTSSTSLNVDVVEQVSRTTEGKPDESKEEELKGKEGLFDRIIQSTTTIRNMNHTLQYNIKTTTLNLVKQHSSETSTKINTYSTAKPQHSEGDLGRKTVQKGITEIASSVKEENIVPTSTKIIVEERQLLTVTNENTINSQTAVPTHVTETDGDLSNTAGVRTTKEENENQSETNQPRSTDNLLDFGAGKSVSPMTISKLELINKQSRSTENLLNLSADKSVAPMKVSKLELITETTNGDLTSKDNLNHSFSSKASTIAKYVLNTTNKIIDNTSGNTVITKDNDLNLPHSTELYLNNQTANEITDEAAITPKKINESNYLNLNKTLAATTKVSKSNSKTNQNVTNEILSTKTAPTKVNYIADKLETENAVSVSKKTEQIDIVVKNEEITPTFSSEQNSIQSKLQDVSTPPIESRKTTKTAGLNASFDDAITVTQHLNTVHELKTVSKISSTSDGSLSIGTLTSGVNQSSNTTLSDAGVSEKDNKNPTARNEITKASVTPDPKNSYITDQHQ